MSDFKYHVNGFSVMLSERCSEIDWTDITQIDVYKKDLVTTDIVIMDVYCNERVLTVNEEMPGWDGFIKQLKYALPDIPNDWFEKIVYPAFNTNFTTIYFRNSTNL